MDCREFRNKHVAFVDDVLPAVDMQAMQQHRATCSRARVTTRRFGAACCSCAIFRRSSRRPISWRGSNERLDQLGPASRVDRRSASSVPAIRWRRLQRSPPESSRLRTWRSRRRSYFAPTPDAARRADRSRACRRSSQLTTDRQLRVRRVGAHGNAGVARGADGRPGAAAFRESGFPRRGAGDALGRNARDRIEQGRRCADLFCLGRAARPYIARHVTRRRREGASRRDQGRDVRAGVLPLRRGRLRQGGGGSRRLIDAAVDPATRDFNFEMLRGAEVDAETLGSIVEHAADDGGPASRRHSRRRTR